MTKLPAMTKGMEPNCRRDDQKTGARIIEGRPSNMKVRPIQATSAPRSIIEQWPAHVVDAERQLQAEADDDRGHKRAVEHLSQRRLRRRPGLGLGAVDALGRGGVDARLGQRALGILLAVEQVGTRGPDLGSPQERGRDEPEQAHEHEGERVAAEDRGSEGADGRAQYEATVHEGAEAAESVAARAGVGGVDEFAARRRPEHARSHARDEAEREQPQG